MEKSKYVGILLLGFLVIGVTGGVWTSNEFIYKPSLGARGQAEKNNFDVSMDRIDNRLGKELWIGDPKCGTTLQAAISAIGSTSVVLHIPAGTHNIAANLTIPVNVNLKPERGAIITVATTKTLTINGGFDAGLYPIFFCTGTGTVVFGNQVPKIFPHWFGAVGDKTADDSAAINQAAECARNSASKRIAFPACTGYKATAAGLDLRMLSVECDAVIQTLFPGVGIRVGGMGPWLEGLDIKLNQERGGTWTVGDVGIEISPLNSSKLDLSVSGNDVGIKIEAGTGTYSTCYNTITLRSIQYSRIGFWAHVPAGNGWTNDNVVIGGSWRNSASAPYGECCVKLTGETGATYGGPGSWSFYGPSFECPHLTDGSIIMERAPNNNVHDLYWECTGSAGEIPIARFGNGCTGNVVSMKSVGTYPFFWQECEQNANTATPWNMNDVRMNYETSLSRLNDITSFHAAYKDTNYVHVPGFEIMGIYSNFGVTYRKSSKSPDGVALVDGLISNKTALTFSWDYVAVGLTVDFREPAGFYDSIVWAKKLYVKTNSEVPRQAQLAIICYDAAGTILYGSSPAYVQGARWHDHDDGAWDAGHYYSVQGVSPTQVLSFHPNVAKAFVGIMAAGSSGQSFSGLEILAPYSASCRTTYTGPQELPGLLYAAGAPTAWHFQVGEKVHNEAPASGQPQGWVCTKRTDTTLTANGSGGDLTITVNSISGIANGDIIGVKLNTGLYHFTTVNGAPAGNTVTLTAALPGSGVVATSGHTVVLNLWAAMPNL